MRQYLDLVQRIKDHGTFRNKERTGTGTQAIFGDQIRMDLSEGFPLLTTKRVPMRLISHELLWFISGDTSIKYLVDNDVHIWDEWAYETFKQSPDFHGESMDDYLSEVKENDEFAEKHAQLGPIYGKQWRAWDRADGSTLDQLGETIERIKNDPESRRHIVSGWNIGEIDGLVKGKKTAPPPCHTLFQFDVDGDRLSCQLYQRSADVFLGVPFNIASYALLTHMVAQQAGLKPGEFVHTFGNVHIYTNHQDQTTLQLTREPRPLPTLELTPRDSIDDYKIEDIKVVGYKPHPSIKGDISI